MSNQEARDITTTIDDSSAPAAGGAESPSPSRKRQRTAAEPAASEQSVFSDSEQEDDTAVREEDDEDMNMEAALALAVQSALHAALANLRTQGLDLGVIGGGGGMDVDGGGGMMSGVVGQDPLEPALPNIVKIFTTASDPNFAMPWQMNSQVSFTSSGFIIDGQRILCNAHGVTNATAVQVLKHGDDTKYKATVLYVDHDCDLALLSVERPAFWDQTTPLEFSNSIPALKDGVIVVGYPVGGDTISITKGIVSRIGVGEYAHSSRHILNIQVDSAINPGNSGGPAFELEPVINEETGETQMMLRVIGVAFQGIQTSQNQGYLIPYPVIRHFLDDVEKNGRVTGFPRMGLEFQELENVSAKAALGFPTEKSGVMISHIFKMSPAAKVLERDDIICSIDGHEIGDDGTVPLRRGERVNMNYITHQKFVGDIIKLQVFRRGEFLDVSCLLAHGDDFSMIPTVGESFPKYLVHGGFVFMPVTSELLGAWLESQTRGGGGDRSVSLPSFFAKAQWGNKTFDGEESVIIVRTLVSDVNTGYSISWSSVTSINGVKVKNLKHVAELIKDQSKTEDFMRIDLDLDHCSIFLNRKECEEQNPIILEQNQIAIGERL